MSRVIVHSLPMAQIRLGLLLTVVISLTACSGGMEDLRSWVAEKKSTTAPPIEPLPEIKPYETFEYDAQRLRDPFRLGESLARSEEIAATGSGPRPDPNRRKELLESFPLDALSMVGTFERSPDVWGLVLDPEGLIHRVTPENFMGQNHGRILAIYEDRIDLVELVPDGLGGYLEREASLALDDS